MNKSTDNNRKTTNESDSLLLKRRQVLKAVGAGLVIWQSPLLLADQKKATSVNAHNTANSEKVIWVILRGALDSLHAVIPTFDLSYSELRPTLSKNIKNKLLPLSDGFALHPSLKFLHGLYLQKNLLPIVAVGSGFNKRSHFDGQDFLEIGSSNMNTDSGWLGRAIDIKNKSGIAVAHSVPMSMRGAKNAKTWYPSGLDESTNDIYDGLKKLYKNDPLLSDRLIEGLETQEMAMSESDNKKSKFKNLATSCGRLLMQDNGIDCAMLEMGGWDTHNNQANRLNRKLAELDDGLSALKDSLAKSWDNTVVIVATEFGRTVKENGTKGTDHGTASAMFIAGGKVAGGRVAGKWPGLKPEQLFENRDLKPTSNSIHWISTVLKQQWKLSDDELAKVFPNSKTYNEKIIS